LPLVVTWKQRIKVRLCGNYKTYVLKMYFFPRDVEKTSSSGFIVAWRLMNISTMLLCHVPSLEL
jgi:hypothetical protein